MKYLLSSYAQNDELGFFKLNRDNAWDNKRLVALEGVSFLQNRPPAAVNALNAVYKRAVEAIKAKKYQYTSLGKDRFKVLNRKLNHTYKFNLRESDCGCIDNNTNVFKIPCIHDPRYLPFDRVKPPVFLLKVTSAKKCEECTDQAEARSLGDSWTA